MPFSAIRTYARQVYAPTALVRMGEGMLVATLPLWLLDEGLSVSRSSVVLAAAGAGAVVAVLPFGALLARRPVRDVLRWVGGAVVIALLALAAVPVVIPLLVVIRMVCGGGQLTWMKGQETYLYRRLDPARRGRSMSALAATNRVAFLVGPVLGGFMARLGGFDAAFIAAAGVVLAGVAMMVLAPIVPAVRMERTADQKPHGMRAIMRSHRRVLLLLGAGQLCVGALRLGFLTLIAFRGSALGLSPSAVGLAFSIAFLFDLLLFPVSGRIMDLRGRLHAIVPAFGMLAVAASLVGSAGSLTQLVAVAALGGIANGLSTGSLLTVNSDLAPAHAPGQFLAAVGFLAAIGEITGPLVVGTLTDLLSLQAAGLVTGVVGLVGVALFWFGVGETRQLADQPD